MRGNLGINRLQTAEQETREMVCSEYYWREEKHYCHPNHQAVLLVLSVELGW
jgi:hypothetical protein